MPFSSNIQDTGLRNFGANSGVEDTSMAQLFQGLGNTAISTVNAVDSSIKSNIRREATEEYDRVNEETLGNIPSVVANGEKEMSRIQAAYDQGKLSDTAYYAKLTNVSKKLRSKYPGYRGVVDSAIQSVTGVRPANALRNALKAELNRGQAKQEAAEKEWGDFISKQGNQEAMQSMFLDIYTNPENYDTEEERAKVYTAVMDYRGKVGTYESDNRARNATKAEFEANRDRFKSDSTNIIGFKVNTSIAKLDEHIEKTLGSNLGTLVNDISTGQKILTPEEKLQLEGSLNVRALQLKNGLIENVRNASNGFMEMSEINAIVDEGMKPFNNIMQAVSTGDFSAATVLSRKEKYQKEFSIDRLSNTKPGSQLNAVQAIRSFSPALAERVENTLKTPEFDTELSKFVSMSSFTGIAEGNQNLSKALEDLSSFENLNNRQRNQGAKGLVNSIEVALGDNKIDPKNLDKLVEQVFNEDSIFDSFTGESQLEAFSRITNPVVIQNILTKGSDNTKRRVLDWTMKQATSISSIREMATDANAIQNTREFMDATLGANGKLQVSINQEALDRAKEQNNIADNLIITNAIDNTKEGIDKLNSIITPMHDLAKGLGLDPKEHLMGYLNNIGVDLNARQNSTLQTILDFEFNEFNLKTHQEKGIGQVDPATANQERRGEGPVSVEEGEFSFNQEPLPFDRENVPEAIRDDEEFLSGVNDIGEKFGIDPNFLVAVMDFETGGSFSPAQKNLAGSSGTGLIQFMADTAEGLGTSTEELSQMSRVEQLKYVDKYLSQFKRQFDSVREAGGGISVDDLYMSILFPRAINKDRNYTLFRRGTKAYSQNRGLDKNRDGKVTKGEAASKIKA